MKPFASKTLKQTIQKDKHINVGSIKKEKVVYYMTVTTTITIWY